jgi:hypothetical protein
LTVGQKEKVDVFYHQKNYLVEENVRESKFMLTVMDNEIIFKQNAQQNAPINRNVYCLVT